MIPLSTSSGSVSAADGTVSPARDREEMILSAKKKLKSFRAKQSSSSSIRSPSPSPPKRTRSTRSTKKPSTDSADGSGAPLTPPSSTGRPSMEMEDAVLRPEPHVSGTAKRRSREHKHTRSHSRSCRGSKGSISVSFPWNQPGGSSSRPAGGASSASASSIARSSPTSSSPPTSASLDRPPPFVGNGAFAFPNTPPPVPVPVPFNNDDAPAPAPSPSPFANFSFPSTNRASTSSRPPSLTLPPGGSSHARRPSRHARQSSVATRRESMEVMSGVALPADDSADSGPGEITEERARALASLEGGSIHDGLVRGSAGMGDGLGEVYLPTGEEMDQLSESSASTPSLPGSPTTPSATTPTSLPNKRASWDRRPSPLSMSTSVPRALHALVEEEEDEDASASASPDSGPTTTSPTGKKALKPLTLASHPAFSGDASGAPVFSAGMMASLNKRSSVLLSPSPPDSQPSSPFFASSTPRSDSLSSLATTISSSGSTATPRAQGRPLSGLFGRTPPAAGTNTATPPTAAVPPAPSSGSAGRRSSISYKTEGSGSGLSSTPSPTALGRAAGPRPLSLLNKRASTSTEGSSSRRSLDTDTAGRRESYVSSSTSMDGSSGALRELQDHLASALDDITLWRARVASLEAQLSSERREHALANDRVRRLTERLEQKTPATNAVDAAHVRLVGEMRNQIFGLVGRVEEEGRRRAEAEREVEELRTRLAELGAGAVGGGGLPDTPERTPVMSLARGQSTNSSVFSSEGGESPMEEFIPGAAEVPLQTLPEEEGEEEQPAEDDQDDQDFGLPAFLTAAAPPPAPPAPTPAAAPKSHAHKPSLITNWRFPAGPVPPTPDVPSEEVDSFFDLLPSRKIPAPQPRSVDLDLPPLVSPPQAHRHRALPSVAASLRRSSDSARPQHLKYIDRETQIRRLAALGRPRRVDFAAIFAAQGPLVHI